MCESHPSRTEEWEREMREQERVHFSPSTEPGFSSLSIILCPVTFPSILWRLKRSHRTTCDDRAFFFFDTTTINLSSLTTMPSRRTRAQRPSIYLSMCLSFFLSRSFISVYQYLFLLFISILTWSRKKASHTQRVNVFLKRCMAAVLRGERRNTQRGDGRETRRKGPKGREPEKSENPPNDRRDED